jgi:hypothetical protein
MNLDAPARVSHKRWDMLHRGRVGLLTASMICFLIAVLG